MSNIARRPAMFHFLSETPNIMALFEPLAQAGMPYAAPATAFMPVMSVVPALMLTGSKARARSVYTGGTAPRPCQMSQKTMTGFSFRDESV